jgi:hypothetical protein
MSQPASEEQRHKLQQLYRYTADQMRMGYSRQDIVKDLESKGLQRQDAQTVYEQLSAARDQALQKAHRDAALQKMAWGAIIFIVGVAITLGTYGAVAKSGGSYTIAYGAILVGGFRFFQGLYYYNS